MNQQTLYLKIRKLARAMRKDSTQAELSFWIRVRNRQFLGLKFNRQFVIQCPIDTLFTKYYIADFHCHELKLVVELDGKIHQKQQEPDLIRTEHLHQWGFQVVRFANEQVLNDWEYVRRTLEAIAMAQGRTHP